MMRINFLFNIQWVGTEIVLKLTSQAYSDVDLPF
jgi:hypothetical protein